MSALVLPAPPRIWTPPPLRLPRWMLPRRILADVLDAITAAAVIVDTTATHATFNSVASGSWTHTPVGAPGAIVVCVLSRQSATVNGSLVTTVTYGGTAMVALTSIVDATSRVRITYFWLANPAAGAQTVAVTMADALSSWWPFSVALRGPASFTPATPLLVVGNSTAVSATPTGLTVSGVAIAAFGSSTSGAGFTSGTVDANSVAIGQDNTGAAIDAAAAYRLGNKGVSAMTQSVTTGAWATGVIVVAQRLEPRGQQQRNEAVQRGAVW